MNERAPSTRQTLSYLCNLFAAHSIRPKNKLGQNFLIDLNLIDVLVRAADLTKDDLAIEVGSGTGGLTNRLADEAGAVLSVEIDVAFAQLARETAGDRANVVLLECDALKNKNELNPAVLAALDEMQQKSECTQLKLTANLPYSIATPIVSNFLLGPRPFERMVVTVQWEIAERLIAKPSTKGYGALAVLMQSLADVQIVRKLPPTVFFPRPDVESAIVMIRPNPVKRAHVGDVLQFRHFLRDLYTHRRKNLRGALLAFHEHPWSKPEVDAKLAELGIDVTIRAEALGLEDHLRLSRAFRADEG